MNTWIRWSSTKKKINKENEFDNEDFFFHLGFATEPRWSDVPSFRSSEEENLNSNDNDDEERKCRVITGRKTNNIDEDFYTEILDNNEQCGANVLLMNICIDKSSNLKLMQQIFRQRLAK